MLFHVRMDVKFPPGFDPEARAELIARERETAHEMQRAGSLVGLWRIVGEFANFSIFEVESGDELHRLLQSLPMFEFMMVKVTPLANHPSKL